MDASTPGLLLLCFGGLCVFVLIVFILPAANYAERKGQEAVEESKRGKGRTYDETWPR